jgi:zinc D-Ala-D-Ala dipeptidase
MLKIFIIFSVTFTTSAAALALPPQFVYLNQVDPSIQQDMRYATRNNMMDRSLAGYQQATCILTEQAAYALKKVQHKLNQKQLSLKVYDCYRPQRAVEDLWQWSQQPSHESLKPNYYPRIKKSDLFKKDYIARDSGHSRGSTIDLTIVPLHSHPQRYLIPSHIACYADYMERRNDNSLDMGTNFDCLDPRSHIDNQQISAQAQKNRRLLRQVMKKYGFSPYQQEWWHFTLKNEPYPKHYFDFPVRLAGD